MLLQMKYLNSCIVLTSKLVIITAILLILFKTVAFAQPFGPQQALSAGALWSPSQIQSADLNNDGLLDIIICDQNNIQGCFNNGDETFSFLECLVPDIKFAKITIADFDNNGSLDIAHVNGHHGYVFGWNKNDGNGNFHYTDTIASDTLFPVFIVSGDIDNDGFTDIILTEGSYTNRRFICYHNDGNGHFTSQQNTSLPDFSNGKNLIDIDNDNDLDLIISSQTFLVWLENIGNGVFQEEHLISTGSIYDYCFVDMDSDSSADIVFSCNDGSERILWKENMGAGTFGSENLIDTTSSLRAIECGDMDNDGDIDILTGHYSLESGIQLYENSGNNILFIHHEIYTPDRTFKLVINDFNNDSLLDFANLEHSYWSHWFKNQQNLNFEGPMLLTSKTRQPPHATPADIDDDNDLDIVSLTIDNELALFENIAYQFFDQPAILLDTGFSIWWSSKCFIEDLDGDLHKDILLTSVSDAYWFKNDGFGNFGVPQSILSNYQFNEVTDSFIADIDNDTDNDLIFATWWGIAILKNDGAGNFEVTDLLSYQTTIENTITAGDINGDSCIDLILCEPQPKRISLYINDGLGFFTSNPYTIYNAEVYPKTVCIADLDNDNNNDVIVSLKNKIIWLQNDGNGSFNTTQLVIDSIDHPGKVFPTDLDDDGDEDLLYGFRDHYVVWSENLGGGIFDSYHLISDKTKYPGNVIAGDLDGDGDKDIVSASSGDSKIAWYENLRLNTKINPPAFTKENYKVFPNPTSGNITICSNYNPGFEIELFDIMGNSVMKEEDKSISQSKTIDISHLPSNLYVVVIRINGELMHSEKVVLIKK